MTSYCTTAELKAYIDVADALTGDDTLFASLITRASARIDAYCGRTFVQRDETRYYDAVADVDGRMLLLDDDLLSVTTLTNGDSTTIDAADYVLLPTNDTPKWAIRLKRSATTASWTYTVDPEEAISVAGVWGWHASNSAPDDIKHAAIRLAAWYYHQRQAPFETTGLPELGIVTVPTAVPSDIQAILSQYLRTEVGSVWRDS